MGLSSNTTHCVRGILIVDCDGGYSNSTRATTIGSTVSSIALLVFMASMFLLIICATCFEDRIVGNRLQEQSDVISRADASTRRKAIESNLQVHPWTKGSKEMKETESKVGASCAVAPCDVAEVDEEMGQQGAATDSQELCPICLSSFHDGDDVCESSTCHHTFHASCLTPWLIKHERCPICRKLYMSASV